MVGRKEDSSLVSGLPCPWQVGLVGRLLCFALDESTGAPPVMSHGLEGSEVRQVPSFRPKRPAGGHSALRPKGWAPEASDLARLRATNKLDLDLFAFAVDRMRAMLRPHAKNGWPPLPPILELGHVGQG